MVPFAGRMVMRGEPAELLGPLKLEKALVL